MDIKGKTKDNLNTCRDWKSICNLPELELDKRRPKLMPKPTYTLSKEQKSRVCEWIKGLQFPDGYVYNLARCVDMTELWMHGMKSHDCHVFMQKLIPIAFQDMLPEHVMYSYLNELYQHHHSGDPIIDRLVSTGFKDWFKQRTERHNTGKSTMNCDMCVKSSSYTDEDNDFYGIIKEIIQLTNPLIPDLHIVLFKCRWVDLVRGMKARRVIDESKWTEICAYQLDEVLRVPVVGTDNQMYHLRDPNGLQVMIDNQAAGTSRSQTCQTDDNEDYDEDSFEDDETDDDEYELTN
ncbi:UNVERIFIED_CONTAM: hypothetical protein Slati_3682600 [Sesamum latifolium]|uniref:DUF4216 domain-containing protein n=1 Tax=Sesamum latifolium TaxID=2727402 RepID=A0AAW2U287_9LAMI